MNHQNTDLRIIKTHKALCESFSEMLTKKGFEDITVNELCDKALIRRPTFYKHFSDKYDFFGFYVRYISDSFALDYDTNKTNYPYPDYMFEHTLDFFEKNDRLVKNVQNSTAFASLIIIICDEIQRNIYLYMSAQKEKEHLTETSLTILSNFFAGGIAQLLKFWIENQDNVSREELIENYKRLHAMIM